MTTQATGLNAPRKRQAPGASPMRTRAVKWNDEEWQRIQEAAAALGMSTGEFIRQAVREKV